MLLEVHDDKFCIIVAFAWDLNCQAFSSVMTITERDPRPRITSFSLVIYFYTMRATSAINIAIRPTHVKYYVTKRTSMSSDA